MHTTAAQGALPICTWQASVASGRKKNQPLTASAAPAAPQQHRAALHCKQQQTYASRKLPSPPVQRLLLHNTPGRHCIASNKSASRNSRKLPSPPVQRLLLRRSQQVPHNGCRLRWIGSRTRAATDEQGWPTSDARDSNVLRVTARVETDEKATRLTTAGSRCAGRVRRKAVMRKQRWMPAWASVPVCAAARRRVRRSWAMSTRLAVGQ